MDQAAGVNYVPQIIPMLFPGIKNFFYYEKKMNPEQVDQDLENLYNLIDQKQDEFEMDLNFTVWVVQPDDPEMLEDKNQTRYIIGIDLFHEEVPE